MKGLIRKGRKWAYQAAIPEDVRDHFGGKKKHTASFNTEDQLHAERLAAEADREFWITVNQHRTNALNGDRIPPERKQQLAGWLFGQLYNQYRDEFVDMEEQCQSIIMEAWEDGFPLASGIDFEGVVFKEIVRSVEVLLEYTEGRDWEKKRAEKRPTATLNGACEAWAKKAKHLQKTKDQYAKDVRDFTEWFEQHGHGTCYGAKINKGHVNQYVGYLMHKDRAKATIMRSLAALRLIYKSGQFSDENPFHGVTDRMVVEGKELKVRAFTDHEVVNILKDREADENARMCMVIAAYSGMRLSEICSLKIEHIEKVGKSPVFNLMNAGRRKTKAAYRKVPVHPLVWKTLRPFIEGRGASDWIIPNEKADKY